MIKVSQLLLFAILQQGKLFEMTLFQLGIICIDKIIHDRYYKIQVKLNLYKIWKNKILIIQNRKGGYYNHDAVSLFI